MHSRISSSFVIVSGDFVRTGGMDHANYALASYLSRIGNQVDLVAHRVAADLASRPNVAVRHAPKPFNSYFLGQGPLRRRGNEIGRATFASGGRVVANGGNCDFPDVNWVHYVHAAYHPQTSASVLRKVRTAFEHPHNVRAERRALRSARLVVCNSERTRRDVIEHHAVEPSRTRVIYYGTDPRRFFPLDSAARSELRKRLGFSEFGFTILFVGALGDRRKGFDTLFDAWQRACRSPQWNAELLVVGQGAEMPHWVRRVREEGLQNQIRFLGFQSNVAELLQAADALVAPTRYEAYGLGVHEALCCGVPALVSHDAGVAERYPQELNELLLPRPDDPAALAEKLIGWRTNPEQWRERVRSLSEHLRAYTWDDMARRFLTVMEEAG